jgi:hypothetical protein
METFIPPKGFSHNCCSRLRHDSRQVVPRVFERKMLPPTSGLEWVMLGKQQIIYVKVVRRKKYHGGYEWKITSSAIFELLEYIDISQICVLPSLCQ